jgi:hypothetical protein
MRRPRSDRGLAGRERSPLIVVKRRFFEQYLAGQKDTEYRRPPYTQRNFYPGRAVRIAYRYDIARHPVTEARVVDSAIVPASACDRDLLHHYPDLTPTDEIIVIKLVITQIPTYFR